MERTTIDFGIDLGTTNSTIAVIDDIDAKPIPNTLGSTITPSAVWIDKRNAVRVGLEPKQRALVDDQDNADIEFKLRMGLGADGKKAFLRSGRELLPEELSAEVLKELRRDVMSSMGEDIRGAVITVPAAFENSQTNATMKAARLAGLSVSPLLLEPVAASLAYGFQTESENVYWFVYDFGGGTFDAAVMRIRDGMIQVVNHDGDNFLGGKLFDWDIVTEKLIPAAAAQFNLPDIRRGNPRWRNAVGKMKWHAEQAKVEVCRTRAPAEIWIEGLCEDADGRTVDFAHTLTPADVEEVSRPFIEKSLALCRTTLQKTGLHGANMERILMVGGTTLNPWVRDAVQSELGSRMEFGIDPVTVVARGAAIFASTQALPGTGSKVLPAGTWQIEIEHKPVGNVSDPDIGGRVVAPEHRSAGGCTIEFVDVRTQWRSGKVVLGIDGVFMTQLYAEKQRRHEYAIELCDATGTRITTSPERVAYTIGVIPEENPPAAMTIGIGLANESMKKYIQKGTKLPFRQTVDHYTTVPLRARHAEDVVRIPLLEGEHAQAPRNHGIGVMTISGADIKRDLPAGSQLEITLMMDSSQQLRLQVYIAALDEDFEMRFDSQMKHKSLPELRKEVDLQKSRLAEARRKAASTASTVAEASLSAIDDQRMLEDIDTLADRAQQDGDAVAQLDRRLRALAAAVDKAEDAVEWPVLLEQAEEFRSSAERIVEEYGEPRDRTHLKSLKDEMQRAVDARDADLLRRHMGEFEHLQFEVLDRRDAFHVARFNWLVERLSSMRDPARAQEVIAQGRRALNNNDIGVLKAANRQLLSMLPRDAQEEARHVNVGDTITGH